MSSQITTARLPPDTRIKLDALSRVKGKTKSDIIKESIDFYYERQDKVGYHQGIHRFLLRAGRESNRFLYSGRAIFW